MLRRGLTFFLAFMLTHGLHAFAQSEDTELDMIEAEVKKAERKPRQRPRQQERQEPAANPSDLKVETLTDLSKLQPFEDVSVLQKRFMPKTGRFQFHGNLTTVANDPWVTGIGLGGKVSYSFSEAWGVEFGMFSLGNSPKEIKNDLNNRAGTTATLVATKSYMGGSVMYTPMYGKISLFNNRIIPYDMYFTLGMGNSGLENSTVSSASTFQFGVGQIYALDKSLGFRWDLSFQNFSTPAGKVKNINLDAGVYTNVILSLGASWYWPGAKYR